MLLFTQSTYTVAVTALTNFMLFLTDTPARMFLSAQNQPICLTAPDHSSFLLQVLLISICGRLTSQQKTTQAQI